MSGKSTSYPMERVHTPFRGRVPTSILGYPKWYNVKYDNFDRSSCMCTSYMEENLEEENVPSRDLSLVCRDLTTV
jgi:hypothetical protein